MEFSYFPKGICPRRIVFELQNGIAHNLQFEGGCNGNAQGLARMVEGMPAKDVIQRLRGIVCGSRSSSCPDQLALALEQALAQQETMKDVMLKASE